MYQVSPRHAQYLRDHAIADRFIEHCETVPEGLAFHFVGTTGRSARQVRLDNPRDPGTKYIGPSGVPSIMPVPPGYEELVADPTVPIVIVEGSKGHLAAASAVDVDRLSTSHAIAIVGLLGCWGWSSDNRPTEDLKAIPFENRQVHVMLDADMASNRAVWEAASALFDYLKLNAGAASVKFCRVPGRDKESVDDFLATLDPDKRGEAFRRLRDFAQKEGPGRAPARGSNSPFFDNSGEFLPLDLYQHITRDYSLAVTLEESVAVYRGGYYRNGESREFDRIVQDKLGNKYRKQRRDEVTEAAILQLKGIGAVIPERPSQRLINVRNGLLDPVTLELHPHTPDFRTLWQFDIEWDPEATCPTYETWIEQVCPGRAEEIEDAVAPMLDPTRVPSKAVFLYGPSRSGKSTYGRLLAAIVGQDATSAVSLHQLSDNKFASANLLGKRLNLSMDLKSSDIKDLSEFKKMTGDDKVHADRKYGQQFKFSNMALMVFAANEIPASPENSQAYLARMAPFKFPNTFLGAEDPTIEKRMLKELPGIFRRFVLALQKQIERGNYIDTSSREDYEEFRLSSNKVSLYLSEKTVPDDGAGTPRSELYLDYQGWCRDNGTFAKGRTNFFASVVSEGVKVKQRKGVRAFNVKIIDPEKITGTPDDNPPAPPSDPPGPAPDSPPAPTPQGIVAFDTETDSADRLHHHDPGFVRVVEPPSVIEHFEAGGTVAAHNGFAYDFHAMNMDVVAAGDEGRLVDTMILSILDTPPLGRQGGRESLRQYSLDACAERYGFEGKSADVKALAKQYGGFDKIPLHVLQPYCQQDAHIAQQIVDRVGLDDYAKREMRVMARLAGPITGTGFRVDTALLDQRIEEGESRKQEALAVLQSRYGLPTTGKSPQASAAGKAAITKAFADLGVTLPLTATGVPALGKEALASLDLDGEAADLRDAVLSINGTRTVYQTVKDSLVGDRVHPTVMPIQASGRFSIWNPGLTVLGKRGGKFVERDVFLPEPGHSIIAADLSQIDARAVAIQCQDEAYAKLFEPGRDSHTELAVMLWNDPSMREVAKAARHAGSYGAGLATMMRTTGLPEGVVRDYLTKTREMFPDLAAWQERAYRAGERGELLDNGFGRKLRVDPKHAYTQAPAFLGQGMARDLFTSCVLRLPLDVVRFCRSAVHDELVFSVPNDRIDEVSAIIKDAMTFMASDVLDMDEGTIDIPILCEVSKPAPTWGHCYRH